MKAKSLHEIYKAVQKMGYEIEVPWDVACYLANQESNKICVVGSEVSLGSDYGSLSECRAAIEWYVKQLGGSVKWES